jgi:hypothetical protein
VRSPFGALHNLLSSHLEKGIAFPSGLKDSLIHERCDTVIVVSGNELGESTGIEFAPRCLESRGESLSVLEDIVRDRNSGFHTKSMTADPYSVKPFGTIAISGSRPWAN